jgi:SNF2 family DNA or RNA helicase
MVRSTRSVTQLRLPPRFAFTTRVDATDVERSFYKGVSQLVTNAATRPSAGVSRMALRKLLEAAGSSPQAALRTLEKLRSSQDSTVQSSVEELLAVGAQIETGSKTRKVLELLKSLPDRKIVFVNYLATLFHLQEALQQHGIPYVSVHGGLTPEQKAAANPAWMTRRVNRNWRCRFDGADGERKMLNSFHLAAHASCRSRRGLRGISPLHPATLDRLRS